jgi:hypothetical protein
MMFTSSRSFAKGMLASALMAMSLLVHSPSPARAKKSVQKLKKRLHKAERKTGVVLSRVAEAVADGLSETNVEAGVDDSDDGGCHFAITTATVGNVRPLSAQKPHNPKPGKTVHPAK